MESLLLIYFWLQVCIWMTALLCLILGAINLLLWMTKNGTELVEE